MHPELGLTDGLYMDADKLWAACFGLMHAHVPSDALGAGGIVDGYEALPLLHCAGNLRWDAQALLLDLSVEAVEVQVYDGSMTGMQGLSSPADLHLTCTGTESGCGAMTGHTSLSVRLCAPKASSSVLGTRGLA